MENKEIQELKIQSDNYAKKTGIKLNPNGKIVDRIINGLLKNKQKYGAIYCPCRVVTGDKEKDKEIICPCIFHKKEIELQGQCLCQLFVKKS
jgi:ferredoxin-thioredoxin reductase catalytic subunit|tara:strand:- start:528 stop:803 length:276 start_codon:yes stop_codon:yes gene_type:complete